jgi:hypothetical protein
MGGAFFDRNHGAPGPVFRMAAGRHHHGLPRDAAATDGGMPRLEWRKGKRELNDEETARHINLDREMRTTDFTDFTDV